MLYSGFLLVIQVLESFLKLFIYFIYSLLAVLGLHCCAGFCLVAESRGHSLVAVCRLLLALVGPQALGHKGFSSRSTWAQFCGSGVLEHSLSSCGNGLSCSAACGILPDQGSNLCLLLWQADSLPLDHQGSPRSLNLKVAKTLAIISSNSSF